MKRRLTERIRAAWRAFRDDEDGLGDGVVVTLERCGNLALMSKYGRSFDEREAEFIRGWWSLAMSRGHWREGDVWH